MIQVVNNFSYPIIQDDDRDAYVSWNHHQARGSLGGVDLAYPAGSPVTANADGIVTTSGNSGSGGITSTLQLDDGRQIQYMHLQAARVANGTRVTLGTVIATSGASGFGSSDYYAPHLHVHMILQNGTRVNLWDYFTGGATAPAPIVAKNKEENIMLAIEQNQNTDGPDYLKIAVYGEGRWVEILPNNRSLYNAYRGVHNSQVDAGNAYFKLPQSAKSVDQIGWNAVKSIHS
ncbi:MULTISPECIES: M23 family metallopeptidase [unclassified Rathayibacter]|uniref:M23 family metallopeptidase n=1 Tax=unclassified Rathayibacter TaxID=2609250 RepID=UPI00188D2311|nr:MULTISPECIES: M23 family metallopeptidase [unclassified Rathayibacter]MBF4461468.1 M23 family metallopeptidase [Rathayibacter sp. VKM Ac-2879]MBF4502879.1 M23 family metallopeptidase [Rathayibacter sp. VKM Ac-2878]